ncbi:MAG: hypothetical protein F6J97_16765 [Leptolyngbya sp. SIO4C1]|nr:hypothetical protein [Leptolyngbya sp. SIO4C1]
MFQLSQLTSWIAALSYGPETVASPAAAYLQGTGTVEDPIRLGKTGCIRLHGVHWRARAAARIGRILAVGETVLVTAREGTTLIVEPAVPYCDLSNSPAQPSFQGFSHNIRRTA